MAELRLNLLGPPEVRLGDALVAFPTRKTLALVIYLAVEGGQQRREYLSTMLWPEATTERSFASLRNTLGHLQTALRRGSEPTQPSYLSITSMTLALNPQAEVALDLTTVVRAHDAAQADRLSRVPTDGLHQIPLLQAAADLYRSDFLTGFSLQDTPDFEYWVTVQREVWRRRMGLIFDYLSAIQYASGNLVGSAETAARWIDLDGLNEAAYRRKMRSHFAAGERGQALDTFELCRVVLVTELGIQPEPDTQLLASRIRQALDIATPELPQIGTPVSHLESLFVGRNTEHQILMERYELAAGGQPQIVILHGEAGIGKTRLAQEFMGRANNQGARLLYGRTYESGSRIAYHPLISAFRPLVEHRDSLTEQITQEWLNPLIQLLPELQEQFPESSGARLAGVQQVDLFEALVRVTLAVAEQSPLVLFMDDIQWADHATLDWLLYAVRRFLENSARIVVLISVRSEALHYLNQTEIQGLVEWLGELERQVETHHLELSTLTEHHLLQIAQSIIMPPADDFAKWLFRETRGHPFYVMETLKDLLERRMLHPKRHAENQLVFEIDENYQLGAVSHIPSTVRSVIRSRLNRISPNAFALLTSAAILEQQLTFEHLCIIAQVPMDLGLPALDELLASRLLVELEQTAGASTYTFANDILRDVVYTEVGDARRRLFHRRALEFLEAIRTYPAVLAHHAVAAGLAEAAFRHSLTAGQEALRLAAVNEAKTHLEQARQLAYESAVASVDVQPHIRDLYLNLGQAYEISGQTLQAQAVYDELQRLSPK